MADTDPIAWLALEPGTPILASDDEEVGKVDEVIADREKDIFSGITFRSGVLEKATFIPAEHVARLTEGAVHLTLSTPDVENLDPYEP
jgi:uncharacterized protein YrrD